MDPSTIKYKFNMDATDNYFLSRQLESIRSKLYQVQYPKLQARSLVPPADPEIDTGAEEHVIQIYDETGDVEVTSDYSTKGPRADVNARESRGRIRGLKSSYAYSLQESRAAKLAKRDLPGAKAKAARNNIERKIDHLLFFGSRIAGFTGLCNAPEVPSFAVAGPWAAATPDELVLDMQNIINEVDSQSNSVEAVSTIAMAQKLWAFLNTRRLPDSNGATVLSWVLANNPGIRIIPAWRLNTSGPSGTPQIVAYDLNPEKLRTIIPQEFEQLPPQQDGFEAVTQCHARCGGVVFDYPKSAVYATGMGTV